MSEKFKKLVMFIRLSILLLLSRPFDTTQNFEKLTYNFKMRETWNNTCASATLNTRKKIVKIEIIAMVITQNVMRTKIKIYVYICHKQRTLKHRNTKNGSKSTNHKSQTMTFGTR